MFGLGPQGVVRIQFGAGLITQTAVPWTGNSGGPVSFVAGPGQVVIRPLVPVAGYLVPDGKPPGRLPVALGGGTVVVPGPRPDQVWIVAVYDRQMSLYSLASGTTTMSVPLPPGPWLAAPDGRGDVLLQNTDGSFYDAGADGTRAIDTGTIEAVGPAGLLITRCGTRRPCASALMNPASGSLRLLPGAAVTPDEPPGLSPVDAGLISPDGATAALFGGGTGQARLLLVSLRSGAVRSLPVTVRGPFSSQALAWSPDSRWLFIVAADGELRAVDARTGQLHGLGVPLPPLTQLSVRDQPST